MSTADPLWYKDAVFYEAPVKSFFDADDDGIGDFRGMTEKLDYIQRARRRLHLAPADVPLAATKTTATTSPTSSASTPTTAPWRTSRRCSTRPTSAGCKVIADLVVNHTSDQHAWFQEARKDPDSPYRDYYVWSDDPTKYADARIIFIDTEVSNWTWDPVAGQYFWHRFFSHQPDLNYDNPAVQEEMLNIVRFWLDLGLDGFRCDAVPYLFEREGTICENLPETHEFLQRLRRMVDEEFPGKILLAEANQWPEDVVAYFGTPEAPEFHMAFHFPLMPRMFMAMRREDRMPIVEIMARTPAIPGGRAVGDLPAQPRRADARDGDRRRARLHVLGVRQGPA